MIVFYNWFQKFDPFDTTTSGLKSLANGLTPKDNSEINCDNAKSIGQALQQSIDNLPLTDSRKKTKTLVNLTTGDSSFVFIDPTILLLCLIVLVKRSDSNKKYFGFDLTPYPTALFKDHLMRHPVKSVLADVPKTKQSHQKGKKTMLKDADMEIEADSTNNEEQLLNKVVLLSLMVINGAAFLH